MVTNNRNKTCIVASSVLTWVRLKAVNKTTRISSAEAKVLAITKIVVKLMNKDGK
jgi:hypothetical protein